MSETKLAFQGPQIQEYIDAQRALGAPRGCVDGEPEDYNDYRARVIRYDNWLKATLYVRNKARVPRTANPTYLQPSKKGNLPRVQRLDENPKRAEANDTDPRSWPKEPGGSETVQQSNIRRTKWIMWAHEPGNYQGPWPEGVHPCDDPNEPDPPEPNRTMTPLRPCTNCSDHDPKLRCSPWRLWYINDNDQIRTPNDIRCERCKERGLKNCRVPIDRPLDGRIRRLRDGQKYVRNNPVPDEVPGNGESGEGDKRPPPPPGFVYRYKDGRRGLIRAPTRQQVEEAMPAVSQFSCARCVAKNVVCSIIAAPTAGSLSGQTVFADKPNCVECRREGVECETSQAWTNAMQAEIARTTHQNERLNDAYELEQWRLQELDEQRLRQANEEQRQRDLQYGKDPNNNQALQQFGQNQATNQNLIGFGNQDQFGGQSLYQPTEPPPPQGPLAEGLQCQPCVDDGRGDLCDVGAPCAACAFKGLTPQQCRFIDPNLQIDWDMAMDLDFGMGMDFNLPPDQQFPEVVAPADLHAPGQTFFGVLDSANAKRTQMDPNMDPDLQLATAWGVVAHIAADRGIFTPPVDLPQNPPGMTNEERRLLIADQEYEGDYERLLMEERRGTRGIPPANQEAQQQSQLQDQSYFDLMMQQMREDQGHEDADVEMGDA